MKNPAIARRAFSDGFTLSGLFAWAKMPGGAETLVEETTDLSHSQFADLLMPFSKMKPDRQAALSEVQDVSVGPQRQKRA